ncbi:MAG: hypothetical protein ACYC3L_04285 [Gemmatimonadaceae bacterium]
MMRRLRSSLLALVGACALGAGATPASAQFPPVVTRSRLDPSKGVNFHAILLPDTIYVGQQATYQIGVFLNQEVRQRLRRNPEFVPPETRSLLVYDLPDARAPLVGTIDGRAYEVHVFQRAFFALSPGRYAVPASRLTYALPQTASFFSREDTHTLRSEELTLVVLPVPTAGRPTAWAGAVGNWRARLRTDSASGRAGNPLVVTLRIEGQGNVALLPRPRLDVPGASVVAADERVDVDSTPSTLRGAKEFDWLVTPRAEGQLAIPAQRFSYFDPVARRFETAVTAGVTVHVAAGDAVDADSAVAQPVAPEPLAAPAVPVLTLRDALGGETSFAWLRTPWFALLMLLAPIPALVGAVRRRPRRVRPPQTASERLRDARAPAPAGATALRRLAHDAFRERLGLDIGLELAHGSLVDSLRHEGVTSDTARRADALLRALDAAAFSGAAGDSPASRADLAALHAAVDAEARRGPPAPRRRRTPVAGLLVVAVSLALPASGWARQRDDAARAFQRGREAYASGDYGRAARAFLDITRAQPRNASAWANAGTAAWQAADTARAVQGWQRALRLAPLDVTLRDRLALTRAVQDRGPARVPPVPVQLATLLALLVWLAGWAVLARRAWRGRPIAGRAAGLVAACAVLILAAAWLDDIDRGARFAVVTRPEPLRALPVLGADRGVAPLTGEVARILTRQGAWAQVRLDGNREGWIATEFLLPLGGD